MIIRIAVQQDIPLLLRYDSHIAGQELTSLVALGRVLIAQVGDRFAGWLRWNLFWDNTPFLNMLFLLEEYRNQGYGTQLLLYWETLMKQKGYTLVMTSSLSDEGAQHFYRKLHYHDSGALLLKDEPLEIIFTKQLTAE